MKTNFFITSLIIVFFTLTANSQITKGNWMVGGDVYYNYTKYSSIDKNWYLYISPNVSYFFIDKFSVGMKPKMSFSKRNKKPGFGLDVFTRYYFLRTSNMFNFFIEPKAGMYYSKSEDHNIIDKGYNYGVKAGETLFLNQSVALEFFIDYNNRYNIFNGTKGNDIQQIFIGFGLQIHLEKDK